MAALSRRGGGGKVGKTHEDSDEQSVNPRRVQRPRLVREVLDCGLRGVIVLALLLLLVGTLVYSWSAAPLFPLPRVPGEDPIRETNSVAEASVDISTHDLYDRIQFKNEPGGAWTQGWPVTYRGDEWDREKLKVFVVPHSHNDPGWIRTVEEYYQERTRHILSTVVQALIQDSRRKFIWEEMSYLQRWWQDASGREKQDFTRLVRNGQLEIVGGGWVMNDEANSHYFAILEQMAAGNLWLHETIGVIPRNAWAIDPFGHSPTMAYLLRRMGFRNMLIQRTHYEVKKVLAREKSLEFIWRQGWDSSNTTDILCHMMPFYSYDIPHTCGPEPAICCQFDYWRLVRVGGAQRCPWGFNPEEITQNNVKERALLLLDQYRKKSTLYKSNTLLVPLGDDFRYITPQEAELQFKNYQALFDYINEQPELKARVQFGTLEDYFSTLRTEVVTPKAFPSLSGDFFTYADRVHDYWSGYYVSRPFYKAVDRVLEETLRAANLLLFFAHAGSGDSKSFPSPTHAKSIIKASRNLALFQHHDGVTGTAKDHVVEDYGERMHSSLMELQELMAANVEAVLGKQNTGWFRPEESRAKFNMLPVKTPVDGGARRVVFFNPLEEDMEQVVTVVVEDIQVCVFTWNGTSIDSQLSPEWPQGSRHRLQWVAHVPAMGLATYHVKSASTCKKALLSKIRVFNSKESFACPPNYPCTVESNAEDVEISNKHQALVFDSSTGLLKSVHKPSSDRPLKVEEDVAYYSSRGSGAYLFLPNGEARSLVQAGGLVLVTEGPLMQEVYARFRSQVGKEPVTRSARLFTGNSVQAACMEMVYHVELLDNSYNDMEIIARFKTELNTGRAFYSDLNGFQTIRRQTYDKIPLQGNYYPMPSLAFMHDATGLRFSVHSRQAVGVASLGNGWLEMMLDRRLTQDDGRGLGQGVMDNRPLNVAFHLLLEQPSSPSRSAMPSLLSHRVSAQLNYPMHAFIGNPERDDSAATLKESWSPLLSPLPCDFHVVGLKVLHPQRASKQDYGILLQRRSWDDSYGAGSGCHMGGVNLRNLFKDMTVGNLRESSLNFVEDKQQAFNVLSRKGGVLIQEEGVVHLRHMEIQAYKFSVES